MFIFVSEITKTEKYKNKMKKTTNEPVFRLYNEANKLVNIGKKMKKDATNEKEKSTATFICKVGDILTRIAEPTVIPEYDKEYIQLVMAEMSLNLENIYTNEEK